MEIKYLQVLVMPNDEILCEGKTVGWASKLAKYLFTAPVAREDAKEVNTNDWVAEFLQRNGARCLDNTEDAEVVGHEVGMLLDKIKSGDVKLV